MRDTYADNSIIRITFLRQIIPSALACTRTWKCPELQAIPGTAFISKRTAVFFLYCADHVWSQETVHGANVASVFTGWRLCQRIRLKQENILGRCDLLAEHVNNVLVTLTIFFKMSEIYSCCKFFSLISWTTYCKDSFKRGGFSLIIYFCEELRAEQPCAFLWFLI